MPVSETFYILTTPSGQEVSALLWRACAAVFALMPLLTSSGTVRVFFSLLRAALCIVLGRWNAGRRAGARIALATLFWPVYKGILGC